jgi:hypothetical protein
MIILIRTVLSAGDNTTMHIIHIGEKEKSNYQIRTTDIKEDNKI